MACNGALSDSGGICGTIIGYAPVFTVFWNSCRQVFPIILGHVLLGAPAAWAFAKFHFRGKKILYTLYIVLMLMPFQVTMVSSYLVLNKLGLIDTVWAVILPGAASTLPVFIMTRFFMDIPEAVMEAAAWMGLPHFRLFYDLGFRWERRAFSQLWYWASWNTGTQ